MRVLKIAELPENPMNAATPVPGWSGGEVSRTRQAIIGEADSDNFRCNVVNFRQGATTGWHTHDCDQILVVTAGRGSAGERHWHGATADTPMSHITVTTAGSQSKH
ncbi:MAG: cupin [Deltaproteobacteria bacterium]|nr:cupin [Deltaproteobacteria bacterium]